VVWGWEMSVPSLTAEEIVKLIEEWIEGGGGCNAAPIYPGTMLRDEWTLHELLQSRLKAASLPSALNEALNSGDGSYRP